MRYLTMCFLFTLLALQTAFAQMLPQGSDVIIYFPQFADGGGEWQTTFVFLNPDDQKAADVVLYLKDSNGSPLQIDFGSGADDHHLFTIPPLGSRTMHSTGGLPILTVGWAIAAATIPIQASAAYRQTVGGVPKLDVSVHPTLPTLNFSSPASRDLGIAIANTHSSRSITVNLDITDLNGSRMGNTVQVSVPPLGHSAFILFQKFFVASNFSGTLRISAASTTYPWNDSFVAMTISSDATGIWSGLPSGSYQWPISQQERIRSVYQNVVNTAIKEQFLTSAPQLTISYSKVLNALASGGNSVLVTMGLGELISDSPSELAFVLGHELGHIYQQRNYGFLMWNSNSELDADVWGVFFALGAGYDPYGIGGLLGKLYMATGQAGLMTQWEQDTYNIHTSMNTRMENIYLVLNSVCNANATMVALCNQYKNMAHPDFPSNSPLSFAVPVDGK